MNNEHAVVLTGGYGVVGTQAAQILQQRHPALPLYIAGRNPEKAKALVRKLPNASPLFLDINQKTPLNGLNPRAVVGIVNDPHNHLLMDAVQHGIPYLDITRWTEQVRATTSSLSGKDLGAPLFLSSGWMAGVASMLAVAAAQRMVSVEQIDISVLYALHDKSGPNSVQYMDRLATPFNALHNGEWRQAAPYTDPRSVTFPGGYSTKVYRFDAPDLITLPKVTRARTVSTRIAFDDTATTKALVMLVRSGLWKLISGRRFTRLRHALLHNPGQGAPHELAIEVLGRGERDTLKTVRATLVDPLGQTHLTALGIAIQLERLLGLDGGPAPGPGFVYPDTAPQIDSAFQLLCQSNVSVEIEEGK